jgi:flagellar hook assembly protein FlgD
MKNVFTIFVILFSIFIAESLKAQVYGNEWINYNQKYYAFKIYQSGIHKLDYATLVSSGVPVSLFSSANVQIFGREQEIPIYIEDGGDNQINSGDFILFYSEKNDGWLDTTLYENPQDLGNPKYSLYNDTIEYFFTWNNQNNNKRFVVENDQTISAYTSSNFVFFEKFQSFANAYNEGEKTSDASSSFYTSGEGWGLAPVNGASGYTWSNWSSTVLDQIYQGPDAPDIVYKAVTVGVSNANFTGNGNHHSRHTIGTSNTIIADTIFQGYKAIHINESFSPNLLPASGQTNFKVSIVNDQGATTDFQSLNFWSFLYPRNPSLGNLMNSTFKVKNNSGENKIRIDLSNSTTANPTLFVLGSSPKKISLIQNGSNYSLLFSNSSDGTDQTVVIQDASNFKIVSSLKPVNGSGIFNNYGNTGIYNPEKALLMIYHPKLQSASVEYATYRSTDPNGGNYNVILANVNELYQQYGGGVPKHINGIRRFAHHMYAIANDKPVGLYLMGKGIREANISGLTSTGQGTRNNAVNYELSLIPSFGQPSSDALITSNLPGTTKWTPLIPTGRISVQSNQELLDYLNKVKLFDAQQNQTSVYNSQTKDWQKHILHFVGGTNAAQQSAFQSYMSTLEYKIENEYFGGLVHTFAKVGNTPLSPSELNVIMDRIQEGVSLITFFGHAAPTTTGFEINIDEPANWNNTGKYPLIFTNSCYNGNIFQSGSSKSENFVSIADNGAIGYLGQISLGFANVLNSYASLFYEQITEINYGSTIGEQLKATIASMEFPNAGLAIESTSTQMTYNGDPMIRLNWHEKPEIELLEQNITFSPQELDLTVDSIEMKITLKNLGKSITDTFSLEVTRNFPNSTLDSIYVFAIPALDYTYDLTFKMPLQSNIGVGINNFTIKADIPNTIDEIYDELNNNQINKTLFINVEGILPVIPYEFAVVPDDSVTLKASTVNPLADFNTYRFEIDTTDLFNSPEKRYALVSGLGGVKEVKPSQWLSASSGMNWPLICEDSMVYFWRVSVDDPNPIWKERSFQYILGKSGWGQDHFFQFKKNGFNGINYNANDRKKLFGPNLKELTCDVKSSSGVPAIYENAYYLDGNQQEYGLCLTTPSLYVAVIDPLTMEPWGTRFFDTIMQNPLNNFGNANDLGACRNRVEKYFIFRQNNPLQLDNFNSMMASVPDSHYILVYAPIAALYDQWPTTVFSTFSALGSDSIAPGNPNLPFAFFCKKGDPTSIVEDIAHVAGEDIHIEALLVGSDFIGKETSTLIGPAEKWEALYWKQDALENPTADSTVLTIEAYNAAGALQLLIDTLFTSNDSILQLNNLIEAQNYPFIKLSSRYEDSVNFTPAQIDRWHVLYTPLPEAAIDGSIGYTWIPNSDTITEGQEVSFAVDIKNIFSVPMDSLLVSYWVQDANEVKHYINYERQDSLLVNDTFRDTITFTTIGLTGYNSLWMEVNPYVNGSLFLTDQPEQAHFNNVLQLPFYVANDEEHPILDVTFNGQHILNGDIVSPYSEILISLKDDNPFLIMDDISDTTLFGVYIIDPNGIQKRIPFVDANGNTVMQWIPADNQNKRFKIIYPGNFDEDGIYTLTVQGSDRSGNLSGDLEYKINFEVIHESTITHLLNYPNPFSTSTKFVFTLTGSEVPDEMLIQILTVTGKVVREITEDELGTLHIGRNISEYAWDGRDEFGDQLANGVYLYRVLSEINGESIKHRETNADQYFTKEFGKMYLLR